MKIIYITRQRLFFKITLIVLLISALSFSELSAQKELDVVSGKWLQYSDAPNSLYHYLCNQAFSLLDKRNNEIADIKSLTQWQERQKYISRTLLDIAGPFPDKTALNPQIIRTISKDKYRVEHIIFESQPGFFVTSSLYIPAALKRTQKAPAIIYCSGHTAEGYRSDVYQHVILNLVNKGFIVFAFDPVGQGERLEYFDPGTGKSTVGGPTKEHSYPGAQALLTGDSQAKYMIWDGIRAVDYLVTRKEVDPSKIGITGRSGGGTQSAYIAAYDERIYAAAPENYITNYTRLLQTIGPQDAEQNLTNIIGRGLDHPDFLIVRAPKPALMITTTGDMFSIQGAMETEKEVSGIYKAYGKTENFQRAEDDAGHASTVKNREAMYAFFQEHLDLPGSPKDEIVETLSKEELLVTETGQVSTSIGSETVFSLNKRLAANLSKNLNELRKNPDNFIPQVLNSARSLSGFREPDTKDNPVFTGRVLRKGYTIDKYFIKGEGDYIVPFLLFVPAERTSKAMIYLDPSGKSVVSGITGNIEKIVNQGVTVLVPDLAGIGEMGPGLLKGDAYFDGVSHNLWYAAMLTGRSIAGIWAGDVVKLTDLLLHHYNYSSVGAMATGNLCPALIYAASFSKNIDKIVLSDLYTSYFSIVDSRFYNSGFVPGTVPGALEKYDIFDLLASLAPRKLIISGLKDGKGALCDVSEISEVSEMIKKVYDQHNANENLLILTGNSFDTDFIRLIK